MDKLNFNWEPFYNELAWKLLGYKGNRQELIKIVEDCFVLNNIPMPTLERNKQIIDIDPFTIFGVFNRQINTDKRIKIIKTLKSRLSINADCPISFEGIPVLNNRNVTYYWFIGDRNEDDIDNLWYLFESALEYSKNNSLENKNNFILYFNKCINTKGNGTSKITMALFWINPSFYLNLDSRNTWFIYESNKLPKSFVDSLPKLDNSQKLSGDIYLEIMNKLNEFVNDKNNGYSNFIELSHEAWRYSTQVNEQIKSQELSLLDETSISNENNEVRYWIYSPGEGSSKWETYLEKGIMGIGWGAIGDLTNYNSKGDMKKAMKEKIDPQYKYTNAAHATWQFANEMKTGDIVFVKKGMHKIVGKGVVESNYYFDSSVEDGYKHLRKVKWVSVGEWEHPGQAVMKTLTDISSYTEYVEKLLQLTTNENDIETEEIEHDLEKYNDQDFLNDVYMSKKDFEQLKSLLLTKKNVILQGAPGVGKTYIAKRLAYSLLGNKDNDKVSMVQFHQSYSYEDFIEGFRPSKDNIFTLRKGAFYNFCMKAAEDSDNSYYFIIDEINRGNLSKIFGELFMLIESDKRNEELPLLYSGVKFKVPSNVYIIGLMNTADRSLAMLDYALRRRFAFYTIKPGFDSEGFNKYKETLNDSKFNKLISMIELLNEDIRSDESLGEGFEIGHSYFCNLSNREYDIKNIIEFELIPLLKEYWFDEPNKVKEWDRKLRGIIE